MTAADTPKVDPPDPAADVPEIDPAEVATRAWLTTLTDAQLHEARQTTARVRTLKAEAVQAWISEELDGRYPPATNTTTHTDMGDSVKTTATLIASVALLFGLAGCTPTPGDTITEIEDIENGLSVETHDGREYAMRDGIPCAVDDRLSVCADKDDRLAEQDNARAGDDADREHVGEESAEDEG